MNAYDVLGTTPGATMLELEQAFVARLREVRHQPLLDADHDPTLPIVAAFQLAMTSGAHHFRPASVVEQTADRVVDNRPGGRRVPASGFTAWRPAAA